MRLGKFFKKDINKGILTPKEAEKAQEMENAPEPDMQDLIIYDEIKEEPADNPSSPE